MLHQLAEQAVWPEKTAWAITTIDGPAPDLFPQEEAAMARAVPKRRAEFAFGRQVARRAMSGLGFPDLPLPMGPDRAPQWPPGLRGSISHSNGMCIAVASVSATLGSLGIDIEPDLPLPTDVLGAVCSDTEQARFKGAERHVFSAKEAVFKAVYPKCGQIFGFGTLDISDGKATFRRDIAPFVTGDTIPFSQWVGHGWILSLCTLSEPLQ